MRQPKFSVLASLVFVICALALFSSCGRGGTKIAVRAIEEAFAKSEGKAANKIKNGKEMNVSQLMEKLNGKKTGKETKIKDATKEESENALKKLKKRAKEDIGEEIFNCIVDYAASKPFVGSYYCEDLFQDEGFACEVNELSALKDDMTSRNAALVTLYFLVDDNDPNSVGYIQYYCESEGEWNVDATHGTYTESTTSYNIEVYDSNFVDEYVSALNQTIIPELKKSMSEESTYLVSSVGEEGMVLVDSDGNSNVYYRLKN